jgi:hypothetical protein
MNSSFDFVGIIGDVVNTFFPQLSAFAPFSQRKEDISNDNLNKEQEKIKKQFNDAKIQSEDE